MSDQSEVEGRVSVVIPVYNRPELLKTAVESCFAQTYPQVEVVVVDDGSTDATSEVAARLVDFYGERLRVERIPNAGPGVAREVGRQLSTGEFIQYLDSDDWLMPGKFEVQVRALRERPECVAAYGPTRHVAMDGRILERAMRRTGERIEYLFPSFLVERWWTTVTPLYRRSALDAVGAWLPLRLHEDWEYDCRVAALGRPLVFVPDEVAAFRKHEGERLSVGGRFEGARLRARALAYRGIAASARRAGIDGEIAEGRHFARAAFLLCRDCGAAGLADEAAELFAICEAFSGDWERKRLAVRMAKWLSGRVGWKATGAIFLQLERLRDLRGCG